MSYTSKEFRGREIRVFHGEEGTCFGLSEAECAAVSYCVYARNGEGEGVCIHIDDLS